MRATAGDVLTQVQRLLGEPAGAYYDMRYRLQRVNQAQLEMVQDSLGQEREIEVPLVGEEEVVLPDDFLTFGRNQPYFLSPSGHATALRSVDPEFVQGREFGWEGGPTYLVVDGTRRLRIVPAPSSGTLVVSYVSAPEPLWGEDDEIFSGDPRLARYSTALAYKVAAGEMQAIAPQQAQNYLGLYEREMRHLREATRKNTYRPQVARTIKFYGRRR